LTLALEPLAVAVTGGVLKLNRATGAGTHKLDWDSFTEATPTPLEGLALPHLDIDKSLDLHIAGTVEVTLADVFTVTAAGSVDLGQLELATSHQVASDAGFTSTGGPIQATVVSLQASGSGGPASVSVSVKLVSLSQG